MDKSKKKNVSGSVETLWFPPRNIVSEQLQLNELRNLSISKHCFIIHQIEAVLRHCHMQGTFVWIFVDLSWNLLKWIIWSDFFYNWNLQVCIWDQILAWLFNFGWCFVCLVMNMMNFCISNVIYNYPSASIFLCHLLFLKGIYIWSHKFAHFKTGKIRPISCSHFTHSKSIMLYNCYT